MEVILKRLATVGPTTFVQVVGSIAALGLLRYAPGPRADVLTGVAGNDTFLFTGAPDSLVANFDTISDFGVGADILRVWKTITDASFKTVSHAATGNLATDLAASLLATTSANSTTAIQFAASSAALVTLTGTVFNVGLYAVVNNHIAEGFLASADKVIKLHHGAKVASGSFGAWGSGVGRNGPAEARNGCWIGRRVLL